MNLRALHSGDVALERGDRIATVRRWGYGEILAWAITIVVGLAFVVSDVAVLADSSSVSDQVYFVGLIQLMVWPAWRMGAWPCVSVFSHGLLIVNPLRVCWLPWSQLLSIDLDNYLWITTRTGERIRIMSAGVVTLAAGKENKTQRKIRRLVEEADLEAVSVDRPVRVRVDLYARFMLPVMMASMIYAATLTALVS